MTRGQRKDFIREIKNSLNRYISILLIVALGVAFYAGVRSSEPDMRLSVDKYYDSTDFMDIRIVSTLGLTDDDVAEVGKVEGVANAEGAYTTELICNTQADRYIFTAYSMCEDMNRLTIEEGRLPNSSNECFVDSLFINSSGYKIGDTIKLDTGTDDDIEDTLISDEYTITGYGSYAYYLSIDRGTAAIGSGVADAFIMFDKSAFSLDVYTTIYATVKGAADEVCLTDSYNRVIDRVVSRIEEIQDDRCDIRYSSVQSEALEEISSAQSEVDLAQEELDNAQSEIESGELSLESASAEIESASEEIDEGYLELEIRSAELKEASREIEEYEASIEAGERELESAKEELSIQASQVESNASEVNAMHIQYDEGVTQYNEIMAALMPYRSMLYYEQAVEQSMQISQYEAAGHELTNEQMQLRYMTGFVGTLISESGISIENIDGSVLSQIIDGYLNGIYEELNNSVIQLQSADEQIESAEAAIEEAKGAIAENESQLAVAKSQIESSKSELSSGQAQIDSAKEELERASEDIELAIEEYRDLESELKTARVEYEDKKTEADEELARAREDIADAKIQLEELSECEWYILDRTSIQTYTEYGMDAERIGAIGEVFPAIFFLVAALVSLTTMTRMVEEERTQIGTLKALGYSNMSIAAKYVYYALSASTAGSIVGIIAGSYILPKVIISAYGILYINVTKIYTPINIDLSAISMAIAVICTVTATIAACYKELWSLPATLMRPAAPKQGKRVLLERIGIIWNNLNFTSKSTVRNLVRYKKRFFMTVFGIGGCTALIIVGYGLKDSIEEIVNNQYTTLWTYDAYMTIDEDSSSEDKDMLISDIKKEYEKVYEHMYIRNVAMDVSTGDITKSAYIFIPETTDNIEDFLVLKDRVSDEHYTMSDTGVIISEKLAKLLDVEVGDNITINRDDTSSYEVRVDDIAENYLYHYVYMTKEVYSEIFGEEAVYNELLLKYDRVDKVMENSLMESLLLRDMVESVTLVDELQTKVGDMMKSLDMVVWVLIISAGLLAFIVVYNLNNINIIERRRELATLKVLGFFDGEVAAYVYRENVILTIAGIICGLFLGSILHRFVIATSEIDMIMFGRDISVRSYIYSMLITALFTMIINGIMFFKLRKIDMTSSLKSIE